MSKTNETTRDILEFLLKNEIYAFRNSVGSNGVYTFGKPGSSDIFVFLPPTGRFLGIEIKTGKDKLRPEQIGFIKNIEHVGGIIFVVKDYEDFLNQWKQLNKLN